MSLHNPISPLHAYYVQKVLPAVYDDSLSYYEILCKVQETLNEVVSTTNEQSVVVLEMQQAINDFINGGYTDSFEEYLDKWFEENSDAFVQRLIDEGIIPEVADIQSDLETVHVNIAELVASDTSIRNDMVAADTKLTTEKVPYPLVGATPSYGTSGQVLSTNADGTTVWHDPMVPSDAQAEQIITQWLNDHPEATTTVQDGAITTAKLANGAVTDSKLAQSGGVLDDVLILNNFIKDNFIYGTITNNSQNITSKPGYNASSAGWVESAGFASWYFATDTPIKIYAQNVTNTYYSISVYSGSVSQQTFIARYRNLDNNLPTIDNQLSVSSGCVVAITVNADNPYFVLFSSEQPVSMGETFMQQVETQADESAGVVLNEFKNENFSYGIITNHSQNVTAKQGYNASSAGWVEMAGYTSWYFTTDIPIKIYTENVTNPYFSISIYSGSVSRETFIARYRNLDNNLPTIDNQLNVSGGCTVAITSLESSPYFVLFSSGQPVLLGEGMVNQVKSLIPHTTVEYTTGRYVITSNGIKFEFVHTVDANTNSDCWRFISVSKNNINLVNGDIIGVLLEANEGDHMGGVHGDEHIETFVIKADGVDITDEVTECQRVTIFMYSHLYRPSSPSTNVADRYVNMTIENGVLTIENTFKCLVDNFNVVHAYNSGLIGVFKSNIVALNSNTAVADLTNMPADWDASHDNIWYDVFLSNGSIHIENIIGHEQPNYTASVHYFSNENPQRLKIYMNTDENAIWNSGHVCNGKFSYTFQ